MAQRPGGAAAKSGDIVSAYSDAHAGGVVDLMIGVPAPTGEMGEKYRKYLTQVLDPETKEQFTFPAQYMFKDVPEFADLDDPAAELVAERLRLGRTEGAEDHAAVEVQLRAADAAVGDLDPYVLRP